MEDYVSFYANIVPSFYKGFMGVFGTLIAYANSMPSFYKGFMGVFGTLIAYANSMPSFYKGFWHTYCICKFHAKFL